MFHMPLFIAVSGYLFGMSERRYPAANLLKNRAKHLLIPVFFWSALTFIATNGLHLASGRRIVWRFHNGLWFLTANMFCVVVALLCGKIKRGYPAVCAGAILLVLALPDYYELSFYKFMLPYFLAGILFFRYKSRIPKAVFGVAWGISLVGFCMLFLHWKTEYYIYSTGMSLYVSDPVHRCVVVGARYFAGFAGVGFVVPIVHMLSRKVIAAPIACLGRYTMGIYVLSAPVAPFLYHLRIPYMNLLLYTGILTPLAAAALSVLFTYVTKAVEARKRLSLLMLGL
jgi:fucose 4-O-acetylase-like acetyltransferase